MRFKQFIKEDWFSASTHGKRKILKLRILTNHTLTLENKGKKFVVVLKGSDDTKSSDIYDTFEEANAKFENYEKELK